MKPKQERAGFRELSVKFHQLEQLKAELLIQLDKVKAELRWDEPMDIRELELEHKKLKFENGEWKIVPFFVIERRRDNLGRIIS